MSADFVNQTVAGLAAWRELSHEHRQGVWSPVTSRVQITSGARLVGGGQGRWRPEDTLPAIQTQLQADSSLPSLTHTDRETEVCFLGKTTREALYSGQQAEGEGGTAESHTQKTESQCKPNTESDISRPRF